MIPRADTERGGLPSGSAAHRWLSCPGSHVAELACPDQQSDDAAEGERLHAILAGSKEPIDLTEEQIGAVGFCQQTVEKLVGELLGGKREQEFVEERLWLRDGNLEPVASCRIDRAISAESKLLVVDYKFGRKQVDAADINAQLRFAAAVAWQDYRPEQIFVAIIAPRAEGERVTVASFDPTAAEASLVEMSSGAQSAVRPGQPRNPSAKACHYCRARGTAACPESITAAMSLVTVKLGELASPVEIATLLEKCELADRVIDTIRSSAKMRLEAGQEIPGWRLKPGAKKKSVTDPRAAWAKVGLCLGGASFADCCTVSLPKLTDAWKRQGKVPEKQARAEVEALLTEAGALEEKQNAPSLAREAA